MKIESGKHYSFVGVNGAGKTTLTKLITRLYDNYTGEILLNGKPLRDFRAEEIKACFCALFQDFARYDLTVGQNTALGKINGATDSEINNAIKLAGFEKTLEKLKDGKETLLGKTHAESIDISGGEWQRLAFSRAIISPAPVKILDEPTAALDPMAEKQVYEQMESISRGNTTIFISHRLASAKLADIIFVLDGGKIAEQGNHAELIAKRGLYAEMFESQQSWYE
jgi:ATP-binding cassette subfamily B protein